MTSPWTCEPYAFNPYTGSYTGSNYLLVNGFQFLGEYLKIQTDTPTVFSTYQLTSIDGTIDMYPVSWYFCGSTDGENWTILQSIQSYTGFPGTNQFDSGNKELFTWYAFLFTFVNPTNNPYGMVQINRVQFENRFSFVSSKTFEALGNIYTLGSGYIQSINALSIFSNFTQVLTDIPDIPIAEIYSSNTVLFGTQTDIRLFSLDTYVTYNTIPITSPSLSTTSNASNIFVTYDDVIQKYNSNSFGIFSSSGIAIAGKIESAQRVNGNIFVLTEQSISWNGSTTALAQNYKTLTSDASNVFAIPSNGNTVRRFPSSCSYVLSESASFVASNPSQSKIFLASSNLNVYQLNTQTSSNQSQTYGLSVSNIIAYNGNVFFFPDSSHSNILIYDESSLNFSNVAVPAASNLTLSNITASLGKVFLAGNVFTKGLVEQDTIWERTRGINTYTLSQTQFTNALDWKRSSDPIIETQPEVIYSNIFSTNRFSVVKTYLTQSGSTTLNIASNANVFVYYNSLLTHETRRYFKIQVLVNAKVVKTIDGLYSNAQHLASLLSSEPCHYNGNYSFGFTTTTSSQLECTVFGNIGSDVLSFTGLLSIGAASDTSGSLSVPITPSAPVGFSNTITIQAYSPIQIFTDGPVTLMNPYAFTTQYTEYPGPQFFPSSDGLATFATAPFIQKFAGNYLATEDASLILKFNGTSYTQWTPNILTTLSQPYKNVYSVNDILYFFSSSTAGENYIGVFDPQTNPSLVKHINVFDFCPTGEVYNLCWSGGILYALSGDASVSNVLYIINESIFNISHLINHDKISRSIVSAPVTDGVVFVQSTGSNVNSLNTTVNFETNGYTFELVDRVTQGYTTTFFHGGYSGNIFTLSQSSSIKGISLTRIATANTHTIFDDASRTIFVTPSGIHNILPIGAPQFFTLNPYNGTTASFVDGIVYVPSNDSSMIQFKQITGSERINTPFSRVQLPHTGSNVLSVYGSNVFLYSSNVVKFDMNTRTTSSQPTVPGAVGALWIGDEEYIMYTSNINTTVNMSGNVLSFSSDSLGRLEVVTDSNVYLYNGTLLYTLPLNSMNLVFGNTFVGNTNIVTVNPRTPDTLALYGSGYEMNIIGSNVYAQVKSNIVAIRDDLKYYCTVVQLGKDTAPIDSVIDQNSNLVYLNQGQVTYANVLSGNFTNQSIPDKYGKQIVRLLSNLYIPSVTDINLLRLPDGTETTRRFVNTNATLLGSTFISSGNVYSFANNNETIIYIPNSPPGYSQTFPYSITCSTFIDGEIYYGATVSNVIVQDTTKDFWLSSTYSNISNVETLNLISTQGQNVVGVSNSNIYVYDTVNSVLTNRNFAFGANCFYFASDSRSFILGPTTTSNVYRYFSNTIGTFSTYDAVPPIVPDTLRGFAFDGKYLYTMSNLVYTLDTSNASIFTLTRQTDFPVFSNVIGGFFNGRSIDIYTSNEYQQYDLTPFTLNSNCSMSAIVQTAFLSEREKNWMNSGPLDYVITQVQQSVINDGYYMVDFLNPTKEFILTGPLNSLKVFLNGNLLVNPDLQYMSNVNQLRYHSRRSTYQNTYCVSLSLAPEKNIPSGHINMSRIKETVFATETDGPVTVFALTHNVFRARDGLGGLVFNTRM
jgi:hypothetical protein